MTSGIMPTPVSARCVPERTALLKSLSNQKLSAKVLSGLEAYLAYKPGELLAQLPSERFDGCRD
jgi:hypothetical protein